MHDLKTIGQKMELATRITTLTVGYAGFCSIQDAGVLDKVLPEFPIAVRERPYTSYLECSNWQRERILECESTLAALLRAFPKLSTTRIGALDQPKHLGGWVRGGGYLLGYDDYIYTSLTSDTQATFLYKKNIIEIRQIMTALVESGASIRDLRILGLAWNHWLDLEIPHFELHTLRVTLTPKDTGFRARSRVFHTDLASWFESSPKLEDLSITTPDDDTWPSMESFRKGLINQTNLRRVCISGQWDWEETELVSFMEDHAHSLECLILDNGYLFGHWTTVLGATYRATGGKLALLTVCNVTDMDPIQPYYNKYCNLAAMAADFAKPKDAAE